MAAAPPRPASAGYLHGRTRRPRRYAKTSLEEIAGLVDSGAIAPTLDRTFSLADIALAFNYSAGSGEGGTSDTHLGKISVRVANEPTSA